MSPTGGLQHFVPKAIQYIKKSFDLKYGTPVRQLAQLKKVARGVDVVWLCGLGR